eukprot:scaffold74790_cov49-Phaeocystis_antarctica.AAC.3
MPRVLGGVRCWVCAARSSRCSVMCGCDRWQAVRPYAGGAGCCVVASCRSAWLVAAVHGARYAGWRWVTL